MTDHARMLAAATGLAAGGAADLPFMIEAAAKAAWSTDRGLPRRDRHDHGIARGKSDPAGTGGD